MTYVGFIPLQEIPVRRKTEASSVSNLFCVLVKHVFPLVELISRRILKEKHIGKSQRGATKEKKISVGTPPPLPKKKKRSYNCIWSVMLLAIKMDVNIRSRT